MSYHNNVISRLCCLWAGIRKDVLTIVRHPNNPQQPQRIVKVKLLG
jgi:hypothetical protein